jgi:hypothetical protein
MSVETTAIAVVAVTAPSPTMRCEPAAKSQLSRSAVPDQLMKRVVKKFGEQRRKQRLLLELLIQELVQLDVSNRRAMTRLADVFARIATLAAADGQDALARIAHDSATADRAKRVLVVRWRPALAPELVAWLGSELAGTEVQGATARDLAERPWSAAAAHRLLAVLPCDDFLDAADYERIAQLVIARPAGSFAVVLAAEHYDGDVVARSEAGLVHLLRPRVEELRLWTQHPAPAVAERNERDQRALLAWLGQPLSPEVRQELGQFHALVLLQVLEARAGKPQATAQAPDRLRLTTLADQMRQCRRRLMDVIEQSNATVQRELTSSLGTLERDLLHRVRGDLRRNLRAARRAATRAQLRSAVTQQVRERLDAWRDEARDMVLRRARELASDAEVVMRGNDWATVNELLARCGQPGELPRGLVAELRAPAPARDAAMPVDDAPATGQPRRVAAAPAPWLGAVCSGGLAAVLAMWLGPLGALVGGGVGASVGAYAGERFTEPETTARELAEIEQRIVRTSRQLSEEVARTTRELASSLRAPVEQQFTRIDDVIAQAMATQSRGAAPADGGPRRFAAMREQVLATTAL